MACHVINQDLHNILERIGTDCSSQSWTLTCKNGRYSLSIDWTKPKSLPRVLNQRPVPYQKLDTQLHGHKTRGDQATYTRKHKPPSAVKRDKARRDLWIQQRHQARLLLRRTVQNSNPESVESNPLPVSTYPVTVTPIDPDAVVHVPTSQNLNPPESDDDEFSVPPESVSTVITNPVSETPTESDTVAPETPSENPEEPVIPQVLEISAPEPVSHQALETKNNIANPVETDASQWIPLGTPTVCKKYKANNRVDSNKIDHQQKFVGWITLLKSNGADGDRITLTAPATVTVGRSIENDIQINKSVDWFQCKIFTEKNQILVTNLSLDIPMLVNHTALAPYESKTLSHGDILTFAKNYKKETNRNFRIDYPSSGITPRTLVHEISN